MRKKIDTRRLPPLSSLKGFEAAARRQSIRGAAEELNLTHPAISHQIEALEQALGVSLFSRVGRNIASTDKGRIFYPFVRTALESLVEGVRMVQSVAADRTLRVQTYVTASIRWLAPRLPGFMEAYPDVRVMLSTCALEWEYDDLHADVGLVYCATPPDPNVYHWVPLFDYTLLPVCSPSIAAALGAAPRPADLLGQPLVVIYSEARQWDAWFEAAGVAWDPDASTVLVDTLAVALEIVRAGGGIALANGPFVDAELAAGTLVCPLSHRVQCPGAWGLICRQDLREDPRVNGFVEWMRHEAGAVSRA